MGSQGGGGAGSDSGLQSYHKEPEDDVANRFRKQRGVRDGIVFIGAARGKAQAFQGKVNGQFDFTRDMTVYVTHYYFYIDDADFGPLFLKVCSYAPWATKLYLNGDEWAKRQLETKASPTKPWTMAIRHAPIPNAGLCDSRGTRRHRSCIWEMATAGAATVA